jgi:hypothetical protein
MTPRSISRSGGNAERSPALLKRLEYKWIVAFVYVLGIFMSLLDLTIGLRHMSLHE